MLKKEFFQIGTKKGGLQTAKVGVFPTALLSLLGRVTDKASVET